MVIEHKRIVLREWTVDDAPVYQAIYSDPDVTKYLGGAPADESLEAVQARIGRIRDRAAADPLFAYLAVVPVGSDKPIGTGLCLKTRHSAGFEESEDEFEIGWHLEKAVWGLGYGTELGEAMLQLGLEWHERVIAVAFPANVASTRIMAKIGMSYEGPTDRFFDIPGLVCYTASR